MDFKKAAMVVEPRRELAIQEELCLFIDNCRLVTASYADAADKKMLLALIKTRLTGEARELTKECLNTLEELLYRLKNRFVLKLNREGVLEAVNKCHQNVK